MAKTVITVSYEMLKFHSLKIRTYFKLYIKIMLLSLNFIKVEKMFHSNS